MTLKKGPRDQTVRPRTLTLGRAMRPDHQNNRPKGKVSVRMGKTGERTGRKAAAELELRPPTMLGSTAKLGVNWLVVLRAPSEGGPVMETSDPGPWPQMLTEAGRQWETGVDKCFMDGVVRVWKTADNIREKEKLLYGKQYC
ncbi:unnamed protein product [Clonostachys chloroleuca]|uniref:Uncharacterized protein n=1 Tax=Clonostachys chloroleuca TaxID=1926264 RepID=A0AA35M550_9HYPO|nr:unnamed protein product [Clonostachys chloroleuca]